MGYGVIGNTADSGSAILGSSPGTPAQTRLTCINRPRSHESYADPTQQIPTRLNTRVSASTCDRHGSIDSMPTKPSARPDPAGGICPTCGQQLGQMVDVDDDEVRHALEDFLAQDRAMISAEYNRIFRRSTEDPGTAGDEGEENWADLLRSWLPPNYQVVTKGRILFPDGNATPQVDVIVLRASYPPRLLTKKLYLSSGVVAAFECKNTLESQHIIKAAKTAALRLQYEMFFCCCAGGRPRTTIQC
jgi:hypothetical protein